MLNALNSTKRKKKEHNIHCVWKATYIISKVAIYQNKQNVMVRNNPAFNHHDFGPSQIVYIVPLVYDAMRNISTQNCWQRPLMIPLQVIARTSFLFHWRECMGSNFPPPPPCVHVTYRLVFNRPFRHYALLSKCKEMRLGWTIWYKGLSASR